MKKCNENLPQARDPKYICNKKTGRWVLRDGKAGREILQAPEENFQKELDEAFLKNDFEKIKFLIKDKDVKKKINYFGRTTLLHIAAEIRDLDLVKDFVKKGANINARNGLGETPLFKAVEYKDINIVKFLLQEKADTSIKNNLGNTALHKAAYKGSIKIVELLIRAKANVNIKNRDIMNEETPLVYAVKRGYKKITELLIKAKADVNTKNKIGETPLFYAAKNGYSEIVKVLLQAGANPDIKNKSGKTAYDVAKTKKIKEIIKNKQQKFMRKDGFDIRYNIPVDPKILYIEKNKPYVWAYDVFNNLKIVKNTVLKNSDWVPICELIPETKIKYYDYNDLYKIGRSCGISAKVLKTGRTKRALYKLIDWNQRNKCGNEETFMGDNINEIPEEKIIRLNNVCYNIDELVDYIAANEGKNVDMYNNKLLYWENEIQLNDLVKYNKGLDPEVKKRFEQMIKRKNENIKKIFEAKDTQNILNTIARTGWAAVSDNPTSFEHDPDMFQVSQKAIDKLITILNKSKNKKVWYTMTTPRGINIQNLIKDLSNQCIHGVGFKLLEVYNYFRKEAKRVKAKIKLSPLFVVENNEIKTFEIYNKKGVDGKINSTTIFRYLVPVSKNSVQITRNDIKVTDKRHHDKFVKAGNEAKKLILK